MSLTKKDIVNNISSETHIPRFTSKLFLEKFIESIKNNSFKKNIKISNFGVFEVKSTPERVGRNPLTSKEYIITKRKKLVFKSSSYLKNLIN